MSGSSSVGNMIFKMCSLFPPKRPGFLVGISENAPVSLKSIMGTLHSLHVMKLR
jgi:hypothetical protein